MSEERNCSDCFYEGYEVLSSPCGTCLNGCGEDGNWKPKDMSCDTCKNQKIPSKGCTRDPTVCFASKEYALWEPREPRFPDSQAIELADADIQSNQPLVTEKVKSDGSTASYYELPEGASELQDLISFKNMNAQMGEIFRACYRYGQVEHSEKMRDAKKIKFYIEAEIDRLEKYGE